ncbi:MAG: LuxR C-terminal-related transcriptional regulator [Actinomycetota bacterium]
MSVAGGEAKAVVVDELALVRAGISAALRELGIEVVAETHAARDVAGIVARDEAALLVLGAPADLTIEEAARRVTTRGPLAVIALVPPGRSDLVGYLIALGVAGVALRTGSTDELAATVEACAKGAQYIAPSLHGALAGAVRPVPTSTDVNLSAREREVLSFLAEGRPNREIAVAMSVSLATVKTHLVHVYSKLGARNRNEALGKALSLGLLG